MLTLFIRVFSLKKIFFLRLFRFRLRNSGKQQKLLEDFKKLAFPGGTKREFRLEALLACNRGRLGCKYISLAM